jgi:predicted RNA-binding Zn-ribbon protein involved in translation (DUF1610 family)/DNA polymerase elongation subunit (family B)
MKILFLDIETAPNKAYVWGLFDQNIASNQVEQSSYTLCWSAKWLGESAMLQASVRGGIRDGSPVRDNTAAMLRPVHKLLDTADVVIHYNGLKFDIPTLNKEFITHGFTPPSPYKQLDLLQVARRAFRFQSNKLSNVTQALGMGSKIKTDFSLWVACMNGDPKAWDKMLRYNAKDVRLLEKLYRQLRPWIEKHPNWSAHKQGLSCPKCGSDNVQRRGEQVAQTRRYLRYHCQGCGAWFRGNKAVGIRGATLGINIVA